MSDAPKTYKAKCVWLQERLDQAETHRELLRQELDHVLEQLQAERGEFQYLSRELDNTKRLLAEERAWVEIELDEHYATRRSLHEMVTARYLERS